MRRPGRPPVMPDLVEEHFDELDFLWEVREANLRTPDWSLADLAWHEERAEAHLDGLRLAELHAIDLALPRLGSGEMSTALAATLVLCAAASDDLLQPIVGALRTADPPVVDGIRRALRHGIPDPLWSVLRDLATGDDALRAATANDVLAFVGAGDVDLGDLSRHQDPAVRTLALGAAGRLGAIRAADVEAALQQAEPAVRRAALQAAARCGLPTLAGLCRTTATRHTDPDPEALAMLGALGDPADEALLRAAMQRPELAKTAVQALGALGRTSAVPLLLELARDPVLGVTAAFAYQRITGCRDVFGNKPWPPPPVADGEDEREDLPPDPDRMAADWRTRGASMAPDRAWQFGRVIDGDRLPACFDELPLHARVDVYLRLRALGTAVPEIEWEAAALRQRR